MSMEDFVKTLNEEQKKALLEALNDKNSIVNNFVPIETNKETAECIVNSKKSATLQNNKRREPVRGRENRWEDTGEFRDIETPDIERTPRRRPPPKKVDVECSSCGKSFKVDPRFVYGEYYRCNKCAKR